MMMRYGVVALALSLAACSGDRDGPSTGGNAGQPAEAGYETPPHPSSVDANRLARGEKLYQENCAECHGSNGQGAPNWRQPGPDGKYPAPPLNGAGHAWHHPMKALRYTIKHGSPGGKGNMPGWNDKLSDKEIDAIILWFQSQWPEELYAAWARNNQRASQQR